MLKILISQFSKQLLIYHRHQIIMDKYHISQVDEKLQF